MSIFTKKEIIEYQVKKWDRIWLDWKSSLKDTNYYIQKIIKDEEFQVTYWLDELVSAYDLESLKNLKKGDFIEDFV